MLRNGRCDARSFSFICSLTWKDPTMILVTSSLFGPALQRGIESRFWRLSQPLPLSLMIASKGLTPLICLSLGSNRLSAFEDLSGAGSCLLVSSGAIPSSFVYLQDSVGVSHGFVSQRTILRAGFARATWPRSSCVSPVLAWCTLAEGTSVSSDAPVCVEGGRGRDALSAPFFS